MSCLLSLFYICFSFFFNDTATTEIYTSDTLFPYTTLFRSVAAGFLEDGQGFTAVANNKGNFGYQQTTDFDRSEEHTSELQSLMRISYAVFCLKKKSKTK